MKSRRPSSDQKFLRAIGAMLGLALLAASPMATAQTQPYSVIHDFSGPDGNTPIGDLIADASGNLYGVTKQGPFVGYSCGTVFELSPTSNGQWARTVLHQFDGTSSACNPWAGLVMDKAGNLYGTANETYGYGAVYELSPTAGGGWKYSVIHEFTGSPDGTWPMGKLTMDAAGNVYGTTSIGGSVAAGENGTVFELSLTAGGGWNETVLYNFTSGNDGGIPSGGLIFDKVGNLYGTAQGGGDKSGACQNNNGCGVVFELSPNTSGEWTEAVLHTFSGTDGAFPQAPLTMDAAGNLFSMTYGGGNVSCTFNGVGCGVAFELSPSGSGTWTYNQLLTFQPGAAGHGGPGGAYPYSGLTLDSAGNLWGTTITGGLSPDYRGVVFKLSPSAGGGWTEKVVHNFAHLTSGEGPYSGVTLGAAGKLFGMTSFGGLLNRCSGGGYFGEGCGLVYELIP